MVTTNVVREPTEQPVVHKSGLVTHAWNSFFRKLKQASNEKVDGSGTADTVAKWSDSNTLTSISDGTVNPSYLKTDAAGTYEFTTMGDVLNSLDYDKVIDTRTSGRVTSISYEKSGVEIALRTITYDGAYNIATEVISGSALDTVTWTYTWAMVTMFNGQNYWQNTETVKS